MSALLDQYFLGTLSHPRSLLGSMIPFWALVWDDTLLFLQSLYGVIMVHLVEGFWINVIV